MTLSEVLKEIMLNKNNLAVVIGASYGSLSIVRSLGYNNIPVIVIGNKDFVGASKYCRYYVKVDKDIEILDSLRSIAQGYNKKIVLLTDSDRYINLIYRCWDELKNFYVSPICKDKESFYTLTNKERLYDICKELDINCPTTYKMNEAYNLNKFPVIVKPLDKAVLPSIKGNKVALCKNKQELLEVLEIVESYNTDCVVQEIIQGNLSSLYSVTLFRSENGGIQVGYSGHKIRQHPIEFGTVSSFLIKENNLLVEKSIEILEKINYVGIANFEYKYSENENKYYIIEVNGRFPMATGLTEKLNNNFVYNIYRSSLGNTFEIKNEIKNEIVWVHFLQDLRARIQAKDFSLFLLRLKLKGFKIQWALWNKNDIKPMFVYIKDLIKK